MPYDPKLLKDACLVCGSEANVVNNTVNDLWGRDVDCIRCGDFYISRITADAIPLPYGSAQKRALASHVIRKMQKSGTRPKLTDEFFKELSNHSLPSPAELMDNLIKWTGAKAEGRPGERVKLIFESPAFIAEIGGVESSDLDWAIHSLTLSDQQFMMTYGDAGDAAACVV